MAVQAHSADRAHAMAGRYPEEIEFDSIVERIAVRERTAERVHRLGTLWTGLGGLGLFAAAVAFAAVAPWGLLSGNPTATVVLGGIGSAVAGLLAVLAAPALVAGLGLRGLRSWARPIALALSVVALLWVPLGTLLGVFSLSVLLREDVRELLEPA